MTIVFILAILIFLSFFSVFFGVPYLFYLWLYSICEFFGTHENHLLYSNLKISNLIAWSLDMKIFGVTCFYVIYSSYQSIILFNYFISSVPPFLFEALNCHKRSAWDLCIQFLQLLAVDFGKFLICMNNCSICFNLKHETHAIKDFNCSGYIGFTVKINVGFWIP